MKSFFYLYGITEALKQPLKISTPGVDETGPVESIAVNDLLAWYSPVGAHEFGSELSQKMEDLEWLAATSVRHQKVVAEIAAYTAIVPARFGAVFISRGNLTSDVAAHAIETRKILEKIRDAEEWGVKVLRRAPTKTPPPAATPASGAEYLRKKSAIHSKRESGISPEVVEFANELSKCAVAAAPIGKLSSAQRGLEWQATFLVKKNNQAKWESVLRSYAAKWSDAREIECTGPWPPYSFV